MKVNDNSLTGTSSVKVTSRFKRFLIKINSNANNYAAIIAAFANTTVELIKQTPNGEVQIFPVNKLTDYLEVAAASVDGAIQSHAAAGATVVRGNIDVSDEGALSLTGSDFYKLNFVGIPASNSIDVYAIDAPVTSNIHNFYTKVLCNSGVAKDINVSGARFLAIPSASASKLELTYSNGRYVQMENEELRNLCTETNPESLNEDGVVTAGFLNWYVINVADCITARVTLTADASVIKIDYVRL